MTVMRENFLSKFIIRCSGVSAKKNGIFLTPRSHKTGEVFPLPPIVGSSRRSHSCWVPLLISLLCECVSFPLRNRHARFLDGQHQSQEKKLL